MKKRTKRLIENIQNTISEAYPFLNESEQREIFENFLYRSICKQLSEAGLKNALQTASWMKQQGYPDEQIAKYIHDNTGVYTSKDAINRSKKFPLDIGPSRPSSIAFDKGLDYGFKHLRNGVPNDVARRLGQAQVARRLDRYGKAYFRALDKVGIDKNNPKVQDIFYKYQDPYNKFLKTSKA